MGFRNSFWQNETGIVFFLAKGKQLWSAAHKRPNKVSLLAELAGHIFKHDRIGSRRARIISSTFCLLSNWLVEHGFHWFWMFPVSWASLVVVALVGMSGKREIFGVHGFLGFFVSFWVGNNCPNCMISRTTAIWAFPAKGFQANTAKLGTAFGRARPSIGTNRLFRDVSDLNEIIPKPNFSGVYWGGWIMILEPQTCIIVDPPLRKLFQENYSNENCSIT